MAFGAERPDLRRRTREVGMTEKSLWTEDEQERVTTFEAGVAKQVHSVRSVANSAREFDFLDEARDGRRCSDIAEAISKSGPVLGG